MILVTLGTQDKPFNRLLDAVQKEIDKGNIKDRVVVQAGCTKYESNDMEIFDLIPMDEFDRLLDECDLLITHGGGGTIIGGLKRDKKVIAIPRVEKYGEHVDDHQKEIAESFSEMNYILVCDENANLVDLIQEAKNRK